MIHENHSFYIRHGMTDALEKGVMCGGDTDLELNKSGYESARIMAEKLAPSLKHVHSIFCSPLKRAMQTAEIFSKHLNKSVTALEGLREWRLGDWEGMDWSKLPFLFTNENNPPHGEARSAFRTRALATFQTLAVSEKPLLIIGHAVFFYELTQHLQGKGRILDHAEAATFMHGNSTKLSFNVIPVNDVAYHFNPSNK